MACHFNPIQSPSIDVHEKVFFHAMLSLLILNPTSPKNDIDVYLQPLVEELKELWDVRVKTFDVSSKKSFQVHAALLWTINDFPAYGDISGWSTKSALIRISTLKSYCMTLRMT